MRPSAALTRPGAWSGSSVSRVIPLFNQVFFKERLHFFAFLEQIPLINLLFIFKYWVLTGTVSQRQSTFQL